MTRTDPDALADALAGLVGRLARDPRTAALALRMDDIRREVARALAAEAGAPRGLSEVARQAQMQGGADRALMSA